MSSTQIFAILMAGGSGTRFWPASRRAKPKQFLPIGTHEPLIRETFERLEGLVEPDHVLVVANKGHKRLVREMLPEVPEQNLLLEPEGRNTAPCIAWATSVIEARAPESVQIVLPSDHLIRPAERFRELLRSATQAAAAEDVLVTLGVRPTFPATGFGYIERGVPQGALLSSVARFVEKPERARAEEFVGSGRFLWNSGIFVWSTAAIVAALERFCPRTLEAARRFARSGSLKGWSELEPLSIDRGVLERAANVRVVPVDFEWNDVGSWTALAEPGGGGELLALESQGCIAWAGEGELVALLGVHDLVVVHAGKVTLVCPRERAQDVRLLVAELERRGGGFL